MRAGTRPCAASFLSLLSFFGVWVYSPFIPVGAVCHSLAKVRSSSAASYRDDWREHLPLLGLCAYYSYRFFFKNGFWSTGHNAYSSTIFGEKCSYFKRQSITVVDGKKHPVRVNDHQLLSFHPHGALSVGWTLANASRTLSLGPEVEGGVVSCTSSSSSKAVGLVNWLVAPLLMHLPLLSEVLSWNSVTSASKESMTSLMSLGRNIGLLTGGFNSAALFTYGKHRCYVKRRKGFIKLCLVHGYEVRPCYSFGEEKTFWTFNAFEKFRCNVLAEYNIPPVLFLGQYLGVLPYSEINVDVVVGRAIKMPKIDNPSKEDVEKYHAVYVEALLALFDEWKVKFGYEKDEKLELL